MHSVYKLALLGLFGLCAWAWPHQVHAYHIAGAELTYRCLGSNQYEVRLRLFRDCSQDGSGLPVAGFDDPIVLYVFTSDNGSVFTTRDIAAPFSTPPVNPPGLEDCGAVPTQVCLEEGEYRTIITLPPRVGGYDIAWTRCCRNLGISNLQTPAQQGITFLAHVPGTNQAANVCNNLPTFDNYAPLFMCLNKTLVFDHSATDLDGDSLVYRITNPFAGINFQGLGVSQSNPAVQAPGVGNAMGPPPYQNVTYTTGYNFLNPFGLSSQCSIDPITGELIITPNTVGLFVLAVSVLEYRNGVLIAENKRDMQFYVTPCADLQDNPVITRDSSDVIGNPTVSISPNTDTLYVLANAAFCYAFDVTDPDPITPIVTTSTTSSATLTQTTNPATGDVTVNVCWTPPCASAGITFYVAVEAEDPQDCPYYNTVYDTLWFVVVPPPSFPVTVETDPTGNVLVGDTILVILDVDTACFAFEINSPNTDSVTYQLIAPPNLGTPSPSLVELTDNGNAITGRICWPAGCAGVNNTLPFIVRGVRTNACPPNAQSSDTVWVRVISPPNPPPTVGYAFPPGLTTSGDTLYVLPDDLPCVTYTILDSLPGPRLTNRPTVSIRSLNTNQTVPPAWTTSNVTPLANPPAGMFGYTGQICWSTPCGYFDDVLMVRLQAADSTKCGIDNIAADTFYIRILPPPNPAPTISHDLSAVAQAIAPDTVFLFADSLVCYPFAVLDSMPASDLTITARVERANAAPYPGPGPVLTINPPTSDTTLAGTVCFRPTCAGYEDTLRIILTLLDSIECSESHRLLDTVYVIVSQPTNYPPTLGVNYQGVPVVDTLEIIAEDTLCVDFALRDSALDAQFGLHLSAQAQMVFAAGTGAAPILTLNTQTDTLIAGTVCWPSDCGRVGGTVTLRLTGNDSATCTLAHSVLYEVVIRVLPKPTQPISIDISGGQGIITRGDTLVFQPRRPGCATIRLNDLANGGDLLLEPIGDIFGQNGYAGITATLDNTVGNTQLEAQFCWQPGCDNLLPGLWPVTFRGTSVPECALPITVDTTIYILVTQPDNAPPTVSIEDLPAEVLPGQENCFTVVVQDPDGFAILGLEGTSAEFDPVFGYGAGLRLTATDTVLEPQPHLRLTYCFAPNCYQKLGEFTIAVTAYDSTSCDAVLTVPAQWTTPVADCGIWMPNIFTPNGDGINDDFGPGLAPGVDYYRMTILDRWGNELYHTDASQRWNGNVRGEGTSAEGVYFYVIEYFFYSGTGPRLVDSRTGHVTVLR